MNFPARWLAPWLAPTALALTLAAGALFPTTVHAGDNLIRVLVDLPDVVIRAGHPHYRYDDGYSTRLTVSRDRHGRPIYYRYVPRDRGRYGPTYGYRLGHRHDNRDSRRHCDNRGRCRVVYYDSRYDRRYRGHDDDHYGDDYDVPRYHREHDDD